MHAFDILQRVANNTNKELGYLNGVFISSSDLGAIGGAQKSTERLLGFPHTNWLGVVSSNAIPSHFPGEHITTESLLSASSGQRSIPKPAEVRKVIAYLEATNPEVIVLSHPGFYIVSFLLGMTTEMRKKSVAFWRGEVDAKPQEPQGNRLKEYARKLAHTTVRMRMNRLVGNSIGKNLAISEAVAASLSRIGIRDENIAVVPNQVGGEFTPHIRLNSTYEDVRSHHLDPNELGILIVSRISPEKGFDWVCDLYRQLTQNRMHLHPDSPKKKIRISIVGPVEVGASSYLDEIKTKILEIEKQNVDCYAAESIRIDFLGEKSWPELEELYNVYDMLFAPSPSEGLPRVVVESMEGGATSVGRESCPATKEVLGPPPYAIGLLADSTSAAAGMIFQLMQDTKLLHTLQKNALQWVTGHYTLLKAEQAFHNVVNMITDTSAS